MRGIGWLRRDRRACDEAVYVQRATASELGAAWPCGVCLSFLLVALVAATSAQAECDVLDGKVSVPEECDDGNVFNDDACKNDCTWNVCGDGIACTQAVTQGSKCGVDGPTVLETCDKDGDNVVCDGDCTAVACGDGYPNIVAGEQCDDGNQQSGDGCDAICAFDKDQQVSAFDDLKSASLTPVQAWIEDGIPTSIRMQIPIGGAADDPVTGALAFLDTYRALYKLGDPRTALFLDRVSIENGISAVTFGQKVGSVPVVGGEIVVLLSENRDVVGTHGRWNTLAPQIAETPQLEPEEAEAAALTEGKFLTAANLRGSTKLIYFDPGFLRTPPGKPRLCWRVVASGTRFDQHDATADYYVDAFTGEVLEISDRERTARDYDLNTANNDTSDTCWSMPWSDPSDQWFTEDGPTDDYPGSYPGGNRDGDVMYQRTIATYDYWLGHFGRRGSDGSDEQVEAYCHVGSGWQNAAANDVCMVFGDGVMTPDIFGHEYGHSVDKDSCYLTYEWEPGAVSEALADFFGVAAAGYDNWILGDGSSLPTPCGGYDSGSIRDMSNPTACLAACNNNPTAFCPQPDHYSNYVNIPQLECPSGGVDPCDKGGVHTNSGILNKAFYLLAQGGIHRGVTIEPLGIARTEFYLYRMMTQRLSSSSRMIDVRNEFINAILGVGDRRPPAMLNPPISMCDVVNAFAVVGLGTNALDSDCDGTADVSDADSDNDGVPDARDNCDSTPSMNQADNDGDGFGDVCDGDDDDDQICDTGGPLAAGTPGVAVQCNRGTLSRDNCQRVWNLAQGDGNGDGVGDACQDSDGDGLSDALDNCPTMVTSVVTDVDSDGVGDACDPDADADGICNLGGPFGPTAGAPSGCSASAFGADNCPNRSNADQADTDGDSLICADRLAPTHPGYGCGNACDNCAGYANADQRDLDRDGLGDACDDDRDGDTVPDSSDNCPDVRNRNQADPNGNGRGWGCDADDWAALVAGNGSILVGNLQFDDVQSPLEVLIPSCLPSGCSSWSSPLIEHRLLFEMPIPLRVQIVDDDGRTVAKAASDLDPMLRFTPDPETYYLAPSVLPQIGAASSGAVALDVEAYVGKSYTLRIVPEQGAYAGVPYAFGYGAVAAAKCSAEPVEACKVSLKSGKSPLTIKNNGHGGRKLVWKIASAPDSVASDFGAPTSGGSYAVCVYDESSDVVHLTSELLIPGGGTCKKDEPCWRALRQTKHGTGFKFEDPRALHDGVTDIVFKSGLGGRSSLIVKAKGSNLRLPSLPVSVPLRVQLQASDGTCWQASYTQASVSVNKDGAFSAAGD